MPPSCTRLIAWPCGPRRLNQWLRELLGLVLAVKCLSVPKGLSDSIKFLRIIGHIIHCTVDLTWRPVIHICGDNIVLHVLRVIAVPLSRSLWRSKINLERWILSGEGGGSLADHFTVPPEPWRQL